MAMDAPQLSVRSVDAKARQSARLLLQSTPQAIDSTCSPVAWAGWQRLCTRNRFILRAELLQGFNAMIGNGVAMASKLNSKGFPMQSAHEDDAKNGGQRIYQSTMAAAHVVVRHHRISCHE